VEDKQTKYDCLLQALPESALGDIMDVLYIEEDATPYSMLKHRLVQHHTLSDWEKLENLFKMESLGARKPSQLFTSMLKFCPAGEENRIVFHFMFLQRLPSSLRTLLGEVEQGYPRTLAARADCLWACHSKQHQQIAAIAEGETDPEPEVVGAMRP